MSGGRMTKKKKELKENGFALEAQNYKLLIIGFVIIIIGFILMMGGRAQNPDTFNPEIFSFRRITLAPLIVLAGFIFEIYAIMKMPGGESEENE